MLLPLQGLVRHQQVPALPPGCALQIEAAEPNRRNPPSSVKEDEKRVH